MLTEAQRKIFLNELKNYRKKYLVEKYFKLDESATRLMINSFLTDVLGYAELDEIKTEYTIKSTYADYVIQLDKKQHIVVEVKAIQIDLSENHIRQALGYAANEGIAVIFYGHKIDDDESSSYVTSYDTLDKICQYAQNRGMEFLTLRELTEFNMN